MNRVECEKALDNLRILERAENFKKWGGQVAPQIKCDIIQQLINEHFELKDRALELEATINSLDIELTSLDKALDKACELLEALDCGKLKRSPNYNKTKEQWKEECLEDE